MSTAKRIWMHGFYWVGITMTLSCLALILAGNTDLMWGFEHRSFPLSWACAGMAILAFLMSEFGNTFVAPKKAEAGNVRLATDQRVTAA